MGTEGPYRLLAWACRTELAVPEMECSVFAGGSRNDCRLGRRLVHGSLGRLLVYEDLVLVVAVVRLVESTVHLVRLHHPVVMCSSPRLLPLPQNDEHYFDLVRHCLRHVDHVAVEVVQARTVEDLAGVQEACQPGALQHAIVAIGLAAAFAKPSFAPGGYGGGRRLAVIPEVVLEVEHLAAGLLSVHCSHVLAVGPY